MSSRCLTHGQGSLIPVKCGVNPSKLNVLIVKAKNGGPSTDQDHSHAHGIGIAYDRHL